MRTWSSHIFAAMLLIATVRAADTFSVKYISAEHVYLDGGAADGLTPGMRLIVQGDSGGVTELDVVFVAAHSASCTIVSSTGTISVGATARLKEVPRAVTIRPTDSSIVKPAAPEISPVAVKVAERRALPPAVSGSASILFFEVDDRQTTNLDFSQASAQLSMRARRLWGKELNFTLRGRGRFDHRQRPYSSVVGQHDWQNRLWEFSIAYEEPTARINFTAGRILPRQAGSVGYLDGVLVQGLVRRSLYVGLFGGASPDWMYDRRLHSIARTGAFLKWAAGPSEVGTIEQALGIVGEYHSGTVNREYFVEQGRYTRGARYGWSHTAEFDLNRSWRKEKTGKTLTLSNLYADIWWRMTDRIRLGLSYDNRTNYWTYDSRTLVDSLFDDKLRQGMRARSDLTLSAQMFVSGSYGWHKRTGDSKGTDTYSLALRRGNFIMRNFSVSLQYAGFSEVASRGYNYSIRALHSFGSRFALGSAYGVYAYRAIGATRYRTNSWLEGTGQADVSAQYWLGLTMQYNHGDDIKGLRLQSELGYRF